MGVNEECTAEEELASRVAVATTKETDRWRAVRAEEVVRVSVRRGTTMVRDEWWSGGVEYERDEKRDVE